MKKNKDLFSEADVINLIGYETPLEFVYATEGMFTFKTLIPTKKSLSHYEIDFFRQEGKELEFFKFDSFSNFLSDYQIYRVTECSDFDDSVREVLFLSKYEEKIK